MFSSPQSSLETLPSPLSVHKHHGNICKPQTTAVHFLSVILSSYQQVLLAASADSVLQLCSMRCPKGSFLDKSSRHRSYLPLLGRWRLGSKLSNSFCKAPFFNSARIFSPPFNHEGLAVPASLASQCFLLKQPSYLPVNLRASFPLTAKFRKHHSFPTLVKAERFSSLCLILLSTFEFSYCSLLVSTQSCL